MPCLSFSHQLSISIHAPREGGDAEMLEQKSREYISIHAPREGGDGAALHGHHAAHIFQSTPPARGATITTRLFQFQTFYFNPRPPRGGRRATLHRQHRLAIGFQSTPPARGATSISSKSALVSFISIHAPREGGDCSCEKRSAPRWNFNPRPPRGGRRCGFWGSR